jgi:fibronectin-binding autotransporter adhesin
MANRYWVGGTANWDGTAGTKWATTDGGAGGAAAPTSADDVFFTAASGVVTCTIATGNTGAKSINCTGFTGTLAGTAAITVAGSITLSPSMIMSYVATITITSAATLTTSGKTLNAAIVINAPSHTVQLGDALTFGAGLVLTITAGIFTTNNYAVSANALSSSNTNLRAINLGNSTVTLAGQANVINFSTTSGLTLNAGTSTIVFTASSPTINSGGVTFYNFSFTNTGIVTATINGANTFNSFSVAGKTSAGLSALAFSANQTINGTLTLSAGTNATMRTFVRSDVIGTTRTLICAAVASLTDIDFRDITIAGAAAPVSGTRLGDCKGNSGITFDAAKTVYYRQAGGTNWGGASWGDAPSGGSTGNAFFPLAQDTAIFPSSPTTFPSSGQTVTINAAYNIGTIYMSARTSNTMTLATGTTTPAIYGNWINGTGTTLTGTGTLTFAGRGSQTITSAGKTFTQPFSIDTPGGSVTLQDAFVCDRGASSTLLVRYGTFDANGYNVTLTGSTSQVSAAATTTTRQLSIGSGTWTIAGSNGFSVTSTNLTVTGTGTISLTSASAKTFAGGGIQTYPTLNQGGTGTLTVTGSNKFAGLTNTAIGRIQFTGGTTNEFTSFTISGVLGNLLQLGSTNTTQAILKKPTAWNVGANSTDAGNNTGLSFTAGSNDYLSVSYINGQIAAPASTIYYGATNITNIRFGSAAVSAVYYGSTKVF